MDEAMTREELEPETVFHTGGWMGADVWIAKMTDDPYDADHMGVGATKDEAISDWRSKQDPREWSQP